MIAPFDDSGQLQAAQVRLYEGVKHYVNRFSQNSTDLLINLQECAFFAPVLAHFGPQLRNVRDIDLLKNLLSVQWHQPTQSIIVATRGFVTLAKSPLLGLYHTVYLITFLIYVPAHGLEEVEVGIVGDVYRGVPILRAESHCAPSFYFGSQECNCYAQWSSIREIAAYLNPVTIEAVPQGGSFIPWLKQQFQCEGICPHFYKKAPGVIMMHMGSQAGMGLGVSDNGYMQELGATAGFRQALDQTTAQYLEVDMQASLNKLGLPCDGRLMNQGMGYKVPVIVADYLKLPQTIRLLSGSQKKRRAFEQSGYSVETVASIGAVDGFCQSFLAACGHTDAYQGKQIGFEEELARLKQEIMDD